jgi:hypothetical protein
LIFILVRLPEQRRLAGKFRILSQIRRIGALFFANRFS